MGTSRLPTLRRGAWLVAGLSLLASASPLLASNPIYKCLDANLGLLYTDEPCKDGERLNIRAGDADPAAVARLERARDALDQSAAQRIAGMQRVQYVPPVYAFQDDQGAYDYQAYDVNAYDYPPYGYGGSWWLPQPAHAHRSRSRGPKVLEHRHVVPAAPAARVMPAH